MSGGEGLLQERATRDQAVAADLLADRPVVGCESSSAASEDLKRRDDRTVAELSAAQLFGAPAQIQSETDWICAIGRAPPLGITVPKQRFWPRSLSIR
jgi:hypothetical protein